MSLSAGQTRMSVLLARLFGCPLLVGYIAFRNKSLIPVYLFIGRVKFMFDTYLHVIDGIYRPFYRNIPM